MQGYFDKVEVLVLEKRLKWRMLILNLLLTRSIHHRLYWRHKVDDKGRLSHLFWCDGGAQRDYQIFGDVVAFDATYKRNKYMCPLVVFLE